jgi:hypothetical protein
LNEVAVVVSLGGKGFDFGVDNDKTTTDTRKPVLVACHRRLFASAKSRENPGKLF